MLQTQGDSASTVRKAVSYQSTRSKRRMSHEASSPWELPPCKRDYRNADPEARYPFLTRSPSSPKQPITHSKHASDVSRVPPEGCDSRNDSAIPTGHRGRHRRQLCRLGGGVWRMARKQPVLLRVQRSPAPWGVLDLLLATGLLMTFQLVNAFVLTKELGIDPTRGWDKLPLNDLALVLFCEPAVNLAAIAIALAAIGVRTRARLADFGMSLRHVRQDLWLGTVAFVMLAPPVYGLQRVLTFWFPYDHPLISVLQKHPQPILHAAVFFSAVVAAPIVEEFFYRVLWQGWLQAFAQRRSDFLQLVLGNTAAPTARSGCIEFGRKERRGSHAAPGVLRGAVCDSGQFGFVRLDAHLAGSRADSAVRTGFGPGLRVCENRPRVALHRGPRLAERLQPGDAVDRPSSGSGP